MSSGMYSEPVTEDNSAALPPRPGDAAPVAQQIAASLARLRGPRPGGPPWGGFGGGGRGSGLRPLHDARGTDSFGAGGEADAEAGNDQGLHRHGPHAMHGRDRGMPEEGARSRGPGGRDHGPLGRFAARLRLLEALAAASTPMSVSEVAEHIGVDQPRASRLVQAAVEASHVRREADESDARRTRIMLTDEGRAVISQARGARVNAVEQALADFTDADQAQLAALLTRLADAWPRS